jgi:hypothetical protein
MDLRNGWRARHAADRRGEIYRRPMCSAGFYFRRKGYGVQRPGDTADHSLTYRSEVK